MASGGSLAMRFLRNQTIRKKFLLVPLVAVGGILLLGAVFLNVLKNQQALLSQVVGQELVKIDNLSRLLSELAINHVQISSPRRNRASTKSESTNKVARIFTAFTT
jgi:hypothetical protein